MQIQQKWPYRSGYSFGSGLNSSGRTRSFSDVGSALRSGQSRDKRRNSFGTGSTDTQRRPHCGNHFAILLHQYYRDSRENLTECTDSSAEEVTDAILNGEEPEDRRFQMMLARRSHTRLRREVQSQFSMQNVLGHLFMQAITCCGCCGLCD